MHAWRRSLAGARTLDEIMGIEGSCSNAYFDALAPCVPADVTFDVCSRRSPRDLPNAALSYGYAILLSECVGALHAAGLEPSPWHRTRAHRQAAQPGAGPHGTVPPTPGRPDRHGAAVHAQTSTRTWRPRSSGRGVWLLGADGKKNLVDAYEACAQRSVTGALPGYSGSWRRCITHSAQMLACAVAEHDYQWSGVASR